jgi:hypothetical protein
MGTRSDIIVHQTDGRWKRVYCHWDGYLDHNGQILFGHYNSQKKAEALVKEGDMSSLAERCTKPAGHSFEKAVPGYCVYYGRDRGEKDVAGIVKDTLAEAWPEPDSWTEFTYVWDGAWYVGDADKGPSELKLLADALGRKVRITPNVKAFGMVIGKHTGVIDADQS